MKRRSRVKRIILALCLTLCLLSMSEQAKYVAVLPDEVYMDGNGKIFLPGKIPQLLSLSLHGDAYPAEASGDERLNDNKTETQVQVRIFDRIPLKTIAVHKRQRCYVMPCGQTVGVTLKMPGAFVVGLGSFLSEEGHMASPAQSAGIRAGDLILLANGTQVENASHLSELCAMAQKKLSLTVMRGNVEYFFEIEPKQAADDGLYKLGMWVRDSTAGIGTLSFYDMATMRFGALGHPVTDVDTGSRLEIAEGGISLAEVVGVSYGMQGAPGELHGAVQSADTRIGKVEKNTATGIFGALQRTQVSKLYPNGLPLAYAYEVELGKAQILSTVDGNGVRAFDCTITKKSAPGDPEGRNMVVRITDEELLDITGGIVQGMSGSPVIQNGKLIAVITHVFVNDPAKGYAVYAECMYNSMFST